MDNLDAALEILWKMEYVCCIQILYVACDTLFPKPKSAKNQNRSFWPFSFPFSLSVYKNSSVKQNLWEKIGKNSWHSNA